MNDLTRQQLAVLAVVNAHRYVKVRGFCGVYRDLEALGLVNSDKRKVDYYRAYVGGISQNEWVVEISQEGIKLLRAYTPTDLALLARRVDMFAAIQYISLISSRASLTEFLVDSDAFIRTFAKTRFRELGESPGLEG